MRGVALIAFVLSLGFVACAALFDQPIVCGAKGQPTCGDPDITRAPAPSEFTSSSGSSSASTLGSKKP